MTQWFSFANPTRCVCSIAIAQSQTHHRFSFSFDLKTFCQEERVRPVLALTSVLHSLLLRFHLRLASHNSFEVGGFCDHPITCCLTRSYSDRQAKGFRSSVGLTDIQLTFQQAFLLNHYDYANGNHYLVYYDVSRRSVRFRHPQLLGIGQCIEDG